MEFFNKTLINAVKMFASGYEEDEIEEEKVSFLKYCFKNIECKDPDDLEVCNETFVQMNAGVDGYFYDEDTDSYSLFQTIYNDENDDLSTIDETDFFYRLKRIQNVIKKLEQGFQAFAGSYCADPKKPKNNRRCITVGTAKRLAVVGSKPLGNMSSKHNIPTSAENVKKNRASARLKTKSEIAALPR